MTQTKAVERLDYLLYEIEQSQQKDDITLELAKILVEFVENFARRANWRGFQNIDGMKRNALVALASNILRFDTSKSSNPHAWCTTMCHHAFRKTIQANDPYTLCEISS